MPAIIPRSTKPSPLPRYLRSPAVARLFGVTPETAATWIRQRRFGDYLAHTATSGRQRLSVREDAIRAYIERETCRALDPEAEAAHIYETRNLPRSQRRGL